MVRVKIPYVTVVVVVVLFLIGGLLMSQRSTPVQAGVEGHARGLKNADGSWKYTNALAGQTSPYLLQHAHNPVKWYPWGAEAFELARRTGKVIFLSVGYSTCYWCHVMEREVFENERLAGILNEHCVSIKVDREERPDVDDIYMAAVQMMTGRGGWPMSVFLTPPGAGGEDDPGLKPIWAGTYIPPEARHGLPGFERVVTGISGAWETQREQVLGQAERVAAAVVSHLGEREAVVRLSEGSVSAAADQLMRMYDARHGGFGGAPKFPQPTNLLFLMRVYRNDPDEDLWGALAYTLERMARGGMYDQVGGGFHRYSTDDRWLVPHFEKMLYDNAQLVEAYVTAGAIRTDVADAGLYERVVRETCDYVLREMTDATGAFWSAQDAEVDAREGSNYLWTPREVRGAIGDEELTALAGRMYGLDQGTNFQDPHHDDEPASNVLYLPMRLDELARREGVGLGELTAKRRQINERMLAVRDGRKQPRTDDKVIASWNGMMIAGLARAGKALDEARYVEAAVAAAGAVLDRMREGEHGSSGRGGSADGGVDAGRGLYRTMRGGVAKVDAFLEDYAFLVHGLLELSRATGDGRWLEAAEELMGVAAARFGARGEGSNEGRGEGSEGSEGRGGYYDTLAGQSDLFVRTVSTYDGALPSGNSQMIHNLLDLYELTGQAEYLDRAVADLRAFSGVLSKRGASMVHMQHALLRAMGASSGRFGGVEDDGGDGLAVGDEAVTVSVEPGVVDVSSGEARVRVTVEIAEGYHLNASEVGLDWLIATRLELVGGKGLTLKVDYPAGVRKRYALAEDELAVYEGTVVLEARLIHKEGVGGVGDPRLVLRYQACTQTACLEVKEVALPVMIEGVR